MGKYERDARRLLEDTLAARGEHCGGIHCVSRMRFVTQRPRQGGRCQDRALKSAKGTFTRARPSSRSSSATRSAISTMTLLPSPASTVSQGGCQGAAKQNQKRAAKGHKVCWPRSSPADPCHHYRRSDFGFRSCIDSIYFFNNGTQTCDISQFWSGVDSFLWLISEMRSTCCRSASAGPSPKDGHDPEPGHRPRPDLVSGQLLNAYAVASTAAADIPRSGISASSINMIGYQAQVAPCHVAAFTLVYLEKFFRRSAAGRLDDRCLPFCSLVLSVIVARHPWPHRLG